MEKTVEVITRIENGVGRITLNRPQALHALTKEMCAAMDQALIGWADDPAVRLVMIDHAEGTRGFCAGGDIRKVAQSGRTDGVKAAEFFRVEYTLNHRIKHFPKPYVAILDGVTMGGGVGISVHGSHRIATENTLFAMPETGIGLFPDVGGGWFLPRLEGELGTWLALTGARLKGTDVVAAGIATHFVPAARGVAVKQRLFDGATPEQALNDLTQMVEPASFAEHRPVIDSCFCEATVPDILRALDGSDAWGWAQGETLRTRSPTSLAVALEQLRRGAAMDSFADVMRMEYRIACHITRTHDFSEGVRAVIEDKDHAPRWASVTPEKVEAMFAPLEKELVL